MGKLIRTVLGILIIMAISYNSFGQQRTLVPVQRYNSVQRPVIRSAKPKGIRKMQAVKEGFISQQLSLTQQETKAFWPLYRKYNEELTAVRILKRINNSSATADGTKQVDLDLKYESQIVDIKKHYRDEFYKILPPEKVSILYKSEREFNDEVLKQLTERSVRAGD
ncbi:hypothetical protein [Mucilaginibacter sp.]|uniref:hypothetical protein n=1 Tax=Mucilaginibacter sp. TaxID=1882438 RepID=UPI0026358197|nr:hypothetical protein [Mucilaginibacter sp.]MDB4919951.1 hypothetical protein [Mucilaginibacter sp.]